MAMDNSPFHSASLRLSRLFPGGWFAAGDLAMLTPQGYGLGSSVFHYSPTYHTIPYIQTFIPALYTHTFIHYSSYIHTLLHSYIHTLICSYIHTLIRTYIHTYSYITSIHSYITFIHSIVNAYIHRLIHSHIHIFIHLYTHALIHSYTHTLIHSYIHTLFFTFIHSYMYTLVQTYIHTLHPWTQA